MLTVTEQQQHNFAHFINIPHGLACFPTINNDSLELSSWDTIKQGTGCQAVEPLLRYALQTAASYVRIPDKVNWSNLLDTLGAEFYMALIAGPIIIHHPHMNSMSQLKLSWIRYACHRAWYGNEKQDEVTHLGEDLTAGWRERFHALPDTTIDMLRFFQQYVRVPTVTLYACPHFLTKDVEQQPVAGRGTAGQG